jgi:trehalose synthase
MSKPALDDYAAVAGDIAVAQLRQLARTLQGARVVHVNSTRVGGGVAEILDWMVPLMRELGLEASWEVIEGHEAFFEVTKTFHNALQGKASVLTPAMIATYEQNNRDNAQRLGPLLKDADFVFIHDPQPAFLYNTVADKRGKWVWRCHIDSSHPVRKIWKYIENIVAHYDASIFSMAEFAQPLPHPQFIIAPSIDPLSPKNRDLDPADIAAAYARFGISTDVPVFLQVSRFDRFKDPLGVIAAFEALCGTVPCELVLAGGGASDDPEGMVVLEEVMRAAENNPRIHVLMLPNDAHATINALQRGSTVILQKSIQEGFGLTVTEALWKEKPVIGGNVGGIRLQVHDYHTGFLVNTPEGAALRLREMLHNPDSIRAMGRTGRRFVRDHFLLTRHIREYLTLMLSLEQGLTNYVLAEQREAAAG